MCTSTYGYWEPTPGPMLEYQELSTAEPSLQPHKDLVFILSISSVHTQIIRTQTEVIRNDLTRAGETAQ